jgi:hypothetical protein
VFAFNTQRRCRIATRCATETSHHEALSFCRRLKNRALAIPHSTAARSPQLFAAGYYFDKPQWRLRSLPELLPSPGMNPCKEIDWRICGDQDPNPEE